MYWLQCFLKHVYVSSRLHLIFLRVGAPQNTHWNLNVLASIRYCVCTICLRNINPIDWPLIPSFYGINLNQNVVLQQIGYDGSTGTPWTRLFKISTGGIIITALGFVPGYYVAVLTIEYLGRKWIQIQGFLLAALMCTCTAMGIWRS